MLRLHKICADGGIKLLYHTSSRTFETPLTHDDFYHTAGIHPLVTRAIMVRPIAANPTNARQIPQTPNTVQTRFLQSITDIPENAGHVGEFGVGANHCCNHG